jgi:spore coat polysaccharide biosynthesis predicted glycosyltransferase SpsG
MTERALLALSHPSLGHLDVEVVCGSDPDRRLALERQGAERTRTVIHGPRPHLADLMASADLALGAGGATTWERMCLGLRSLVITLADNQLPVTRGLADEGLIRLVGAAGALTVEDLTAAVADEVAHDRPIEALERGMRMSDGLGVPRVIAVLGEASETAAS